MHQATGGKPWPDGAASPPDLADRAAPPAGAAEQAAPPWALAPDPVLQRLGVDARRGLDSAEARRRLEQWGPNELPGPPRPGLAAMLAEQLREPLVVILGVAAAISAALGEPVDAGAIVAIVALNASLGVLQQRRAEQALEALRRLLRPTARVVRDGRLQEVPAASLVPGDIVELQAGSRVPADVRLLEAVHLKADESALTGESVPVEKDARAVLAADAMAAERLNMAHMGTVITSGRATAVVVATGRRTEVGRIAALVEAEPAEPTPLQRNLAELGRALGALALAVVAVVFALGLARGEPASEMFLTAVSLAVAAVPEGLPAVVTMVLALGVQRMAKRNAIIRRLPAVETLGAATVIATDKTGTLTLNRMTVVRLWTEGRPVELAEGARRPEPPKQTPAPSDGGRPAGPADEPARRVVEAETWVDERETWVDERETWVDESAERAKAGGPQAPCPGVLGTLRAAALANDARLAGAPGAGKRAPAGGHDGTPLPGGEESGPEGLGDPTEVALLVAATRCGIDLAELRARYPRVAELPFDSARQRMSTVHRNLSAGLCDGNRTPAPAQWPTVGSDRYEGVAQFDQAPYLVCTKGSVEAVLPRCRYELRGGQLVELDEADRQAVAAAAAAMARDALRVLAVAARPLQEPPGAPVAAPTGPGKAPEQEPQPHPQAPPEHELERDLVFLGLVGMMDPPRPEAADAVRTSREAGLRPVMVTGDHRETAAAIAARVGLLREAGGGLARVLTGPELAAMADEELQARVEQVDVFARVSPEQKLRIVAALQARGHVVAVTGDGVNDVPALRRADIGAAMGRTGTDVARGAADMVLADDNFATVVAAVAEGRTIFDNIRKFVHYLLSCNLGEVVAIFGALALDLGRPLTAVQILLVNLVTDGLPALALGVDPPEPNLMRRPPRGAGRGSWPGGRPGGWPTRAYCWVASRWQFTVGCWPWVRRLVGPARPPLLHWPLRSWFTSLTCEPLAVRLLRAC